ncbi:hypothetical protein OWM54_23095 [Myxococcus sp. MISCRS1]|jgi:hypothetical protein|uniref:hypothetical protein n=1 Tax=Myxococcus TaxID=32 RepID=UPI000624944C|nr:MULTISPECIES: hypothetical protein [Myxococcus]AKF84275.1 hypothetical protein MFUL124B02_41530 [Myxococcus fulvus 124B02]BDT38424.1 hypothetical protein MFMH1_80930 [Myxococcus sp. MH1]MBZ4398361.1 hypothetical protein [Myxococcus sp. AS-1-15]MBZ4412737.1 hypothetical protein [Myxococcus sp. XM-1-1-1]MCK8502140.1 hypothetical protein [Myxococcus fulvus]
MSRTTSGGPRTATQLFEDAHAEGVLSPAGLQALTVVDLGAQIQAGLGVRVEDVQASEVVLVTVMPDDSGSISTSGHTKTVCDGHNLVLDSLLASKQKDGVLFHTRYLNGQVLNPYRPLEDVVRMHSGNYRADQGTPLYDQAVVLLGTVLAKSQEFSANGVPVRTVTLLITDGADMHSSRAQAKDVAAVVKDLRRAENHIVAAMGIDDGSTNFRRVFQQMGIEDAWILTPGQSEREIRSAFQVFSQSAVKVSQGGASFSRTALGGFGR